MYIPRLRRISDVINEMKKAGRTRFKGCDEDCFNCPYPDCKKPVREMKTDKRYSVSKAEPTGESQARMYTVMLGGYGGPRPNISKKFLRSTLW